MIQMEFNESNKEELFNEILKIEFIPGDLDGKYKYEARIPRDIWNKWRPDWPLKRNDYRVIKFGRPGYEQYRDLIGSWSEFDHKDKKRRANYRARHEPITLTRTWNGETVTSKSYLVPFTNEFFSYWLMW